MAIYNTLMEKHAAEAKELAKKLALRQQEEHKRPALIGKVVKTITIPAYTATDFAEAVRLSRFTNEDGHVHDVIQWFAKEEVGLSKPTKVDLVKFDRNWWNDEARDWGKANAHPKAIETCHTMGITIGLPNEQKKSFIVALGSQQNGRVLCIRGNAEFHWRFLSSCKVEYDWPQSSLAGFVSE